MKSWSLPILAAGAVAAAFAFVPRAAAQVKPGTTATSAKGLVNIVCNPGCDEVVIGNRSYGPSPVVRAEVPAGSYDVVLKRKSQADTRKQIVVTAGQTQSLNFALTMQAAPPSAPPADMAARLAGKMKAMDGWLNVQCDPVCDDVIVDGKRSLGKNTTNVALPPGEHELIGKRKGAADKIMKVRIIDGQTTSVRLGIEGAVSAAMDPAAKRKQLDAKVIAGTASQSELQELRGICSQQGDKACVANVDARLRRSR